ncbi:MAG: DUF5683 domain-containing protein [Prevotellaceae bacterium]|nr:DUF5683 domain-containing protein [Prevotellaceae bacterium]
MKKFFKILLISLSSTVWANAQTNYFIVGDSIVLDTIETTTPEVKKELLRQKLFQAKTGEAKFDTLDRQNSKNLPKKIFIPDPNKSVWYALLLPGAGQIYNRRYWKLPIVYGGFAALAYGIGWNGKFYNAYLKGYRDYMDNNPNTNSFEGLVPNSSIGNIKDFLENRQNQFRRSRDLCIIGTVAFYAITVLDAFVDAALSDFDISPNLSMKIAPTVIQTNNNAINLAMRFNVSF